MFHCREIHVDNSQAVNNNIAKRPTRDRDAQSDNNDLLRRLREL